MMNVANLKDSARLHLRKKCLRSLFSFCVAVMGYDDMVDTLHGDVCRYLERPTRRKQLTLPRGFLKTCIASIAYPIWIALPRSERDEYPDGCEDDAIYNLGPNIRILIASNVVTNGRKIINKIKKVYERTQPMMALFPEVIPQDFSKVKWSDESACCNRSEDFTESTFEAAGVGGSAISRHYDIIIEDDLIYAKKDDLTGTELQPDQDDIDKAIGWHKLAMSLLVPGPHVTIHNVGTRWAKHDLVDYIRRNEPSYTIMDVSAANDPPFGEPSWPEMYGEEKLTEIYNAQGPYMYATQYLNKPMAPEDMLFKREWLQFYNSASEIPKTCRLFTTVDLAGWGKQKRSRTSRAVVLTCGWDHLNHMWVVGYDVGKFDPSQVLQIMGKHWNTYAPEGIHVETVYYQESLIHFARRYMEEGKIPMMTIRQMKPRGGEAKDLRIRSIEPYASNLAVHCRPEHKEFIEEFCDYVPNNDACKKDILDATAYQIQVARPGVAATPFDRKRVTGNKPILPVGTIDEFLEWVRTESSPKDRFGNALAPTDPYSENETGEYEGIEGNFDYEE